MKQLFWQAVASFTRKTWVMKALLQRAAKNPYMHIMSADGTEVYMRRYWLFNPYDRATRKARWSWCPFSIRLHHILRPDFDEHCHDHPWNARTIILAGAYQEKRLLSGAMRDQVIDRCSAGVEAYMPDRDTIEAYEYRDMRAGDTAAIRHGEYHSIVTVGNLGAFTLFITGEYQGPWGFLVDGVKVPWREYLGLSEDQDLPDLDKRKPE